MIVPSGGCGKDCVRCPLLNLCGGCEGVSCLVRQCCIQCVKHIGLTYPSSFCAFRSVCPRSSSQKLALAEPGRVPRLEPQPDIDLPAFTPIIKLDDKTSWFWDSVSYDAAIVKMERLLAIRICSKRSRIKASTNFSIDGKIIVSSVMPDELLDQLTGKKYVELLNAIDPDVAMILDCYTYVDDPLAISWSQIFSFVNNALYAVENTDIPLLGIVKERIKCRSPGA